MLNIIHSKKAGKISGLSFYSANALAFSLNVPVISFLKDDFNSLEDLAKKLIRKYNPGLEITYRPERLGENYYPVPDTTKIEQLGFRESISFEEGIDRTAEWIKRNYLSR